MHQCTQLSILCINSGNSFGSFETYTGMVLGYGARNNIVKDFGVIWNTVMQQGLQEGKNYCTQLVIVRLEHLTAHKRQNIATLVPYHKNILLLSVVAARHALVRWNM